MVIDFGALLDGYHSDMTRAVAVGDVGADRRRMLEVVAAAQQAGVERRGRRGCSCGGGPGLP